MTAGNLAERHFAARLHEAIVRRGLQPGDIEIECLESQRIGGKQRGAGLSAYAKG